MVAWDLKSVVVAAEGDRALGLPGDRLGLLELLFAAEGLDRLVEDGMRVLVVGLDGAAKDRHEKRCERCTEEPFHGDVLT